MQCIHLSFSIFLESVDQLLGNVRNRCARIDLNHVSQCSYFFFEWCERFQLHDTYIVHILLVIFHVKRFPFFRPIDDKYGRSRSLLLMPLAIPDVRISCRHIDIFLIADREKRFVQPRITHTTLIRRCIHNVFLTSIQRVFRHCFHHIFNNGDRASVESTKHFRASIM